MLISAYTETDFLAHLQYASTLVMAPLPCNSQLHILPVDIFDNFSK